MSPLVHTKDLIDAQAVARMLKLKHINSVHTYQRRYEDMPRPVLDLGIGRPRLWVRQAIRRWLKRRERQARR
jgi:glutathione-regulated potassium-efflux system ancillary protein KefG